MAVREDLGEIKVLNDVISQIVRKTARDVEGVRHVGGRGIFNDVFGKKDSDKGIAIRTEGNTCEITLEVRIEYGLPIYEIAQKLQKRVKDAVEQMTGLRVSGVNVTIAGLDDSDDYESREAAQAEPPLKEQEEKVLQEETI